MKNLSTITNNNNNNNNNEDYSDNPFEGRLKLFAEQKIVREVDAYIDEDVLELSYYRNLLHFMHTMNPEDTLRIWVDTDGGSLHSALAIVDAMKNAEGKITVIVTGRAYSAGSLIALSAPELMVSENAKFMLHTASYGAEGKHGDIQTFVDFQRSQLNKIFETAYKHFISEQEIELMKVGHSFWFDYDEVMKRLEARAEKQKEELEEAQEEASKAQEALHAQTKGVGTRKAKKGSKSV